MQLKKNFTLTGLAGEYVAVPVGNVEDFHGIVRLNESGAEVFRAMQEGLDEDEIIRQLMDQYKDLDNETARKAVSIVVEKLSAAGLIDE